MRKQQKPIELNRLLFKFGSYTILSAVLYFVGKTLYQQVYQIDLSTHLILTRFIFFSIFFETGARFFVGMTYFLLLRYFSSPLPIKLSIGISWVSLLGKYLPGKIALVAGAVFLLHKQKVPISVAGLVPILSTSMTICVAFFISIPLLQSFFLQFEYRVLLTGVIIVSCISGICICQRNQLFSCGKMVLDKLGINTLTWKLSFFQLVSCLGLVTCQSLSAGVSTWMVCNAIHPIGGSFLLTIVSISAFSRVMGLLAFFSPAGLGVTDGLFFITLQGITGVQSAALITIVLRLIQTIVDISTSGIGGLLLYSSRIKDTRINR